LKAPLSQQKVNLTFICKNRVAFGYVSTTANSWQKIMQKAKGFVLIFCTS